MSNNKSKLSLEDARSVHLSLLLLQRRMRWARYDYNFPVNSDDALLLTVLSGRETITPVEISRILKQPKAKVSRKLISLEEKNYVESKASISDRRAKELYFTEKGKKLLSDLLEVNIEISLRGTYPLTFKDRGIIERVLRGICEGFNFPNTLERLAEPSLLIQQNRIASSSGMLGNDYMNSGLYIAEYQIFFELLRAGGPVYFSELDRILPFHLSKISRILTRLEKKTFIEKNILKKDKRTLSCELTKSGLSYFKKIDDKIASDYLKAIRGIAPSDVLDFIRMIKTLEGVPIPPRSAKELELEICREDSDFMRAREALVEILIEEKRHRSLSSKLIPETEFCVLYKIGDAVVGVLVLSKKGEVQFFELRKPKQQQKHYLNNAFKQGLNYLYENSNLKDTSLTIPKEIQARLDNG